jgi:hypothetical protein
VCGQRDPPRWPGGTPVATKGKPHQILKQPPTNRRYFVAVHLTDGTGTNVTLHLQSETGETVALLQELAVSVLKEEHGFDVSGWASTVCWLDEADKHTPFVDPC